MNELSLLIAAIFTICLFIVGYHLFRLATLKYKENTEQTRYTQMKHSLSRLECIIRSSVNTGNAFTEDDTNEESVLQSDTEEILVNIRDNVTSIIDKEHVRCALPIVGDIDQWIEDRIQFHARQQRP